MEREHQIADEEQPRQREDPRDGDRRGDEQEEDWKTGRQEDWKTGTRILPVFPSSSLPVFQSSFCNHWMGVPPEGAPESGPEAPEAVICQSVPVLLVKKCRVPVSAEIGSAHA